MLLAKLREQQPDLGAGIKEVCEALTALEAESEAREAGAALHAAELQETAVTLVLSPREATDLRSEPQQHTEPQSTDEVERPVTFSVLSDDVLGVIFGLLCNVLEPCVAVDFSSACRGQRALTQGLRQQLRTEHEVAAMLCLKMGMRSCKELREAKMINWFNTSLTAADLALLGTLGSLLPAHRHRAAQQPDRQTDRQR